MLEDASPYDTKQTLQTFAKTQSKNQKPTPGEPPITHNTKSQNDQKHRDTKQRVTRTHRDPKVKPASQEETTNADTSSSNKEANLKRNTEVTKTFDGSRLCSDHHPYGLLLVNPLGDDARGTRGGLKVMVR